MFGAVSPQQLIFFVILILAFGLLITEKLRNDIVAVLIILALAVTQLLEPKEALAGFGSEAAIVVASIFVLSGALHMTGLSEMIGSLVGRVAGSNYLRIVAVVMTAVALLSAFTHHLTTTAVMLPVLMNISREHDIPPSKLLMPLSFAASLGTTITIIGAPAFLIASSVLQQGGRPGLSIFSIAPIGLTLSILGTIFMVVVGRFLLPDRERGADPTSRFRLDDYFTEVVILPNSPFVGKTADDVEADDRYHFRVVGWLREGRQLEAPFDGQRVAEGDVLLVRASPDQIINFRQERGVELQPVEQYEQDGGAAPANGDADDEGELVQAVVAPGGDLVGRTIAEVDFRERYGAIVVSLWRQDAWFDRELSQIKLGAGDVLVLQGDEDALDRVAEDRDFLMLAPFQGEARPRRKIWLAGAIMLATVLLAAFNVLSIEVAALAGAAGMVLARCLTPGQAYRSIDARIYVFIAGAIPLGAAMQKSGTADLLAGWLQQVVGGWNQLVILLIIFAIVGVLTQFMSDAATTALFAPVAMALAQALGQPPEPYVVTVAMAAVASFLTPIGHHGNLLVYGPGRYQFADFVRVGAPLTIVVALIVVFLAPLLWRG